MPAGASSDDPVGASERGTVVMMPTPGAAMSLKTGSVFENGAQASARIDGRDADHVRAGPPASWRTRPVPCIELPTAATTTAPRLTA